MMLSPVRKITLLCLLVLCLPVSNLAAQEADASDVESIDAIISAVYDVISGDAGEARDWQRWHTLFVPDASLSAVVPGPTGYVRNITNPEAYATNSGPILERDGFHEQEVHRIVEQFGQVAHVFSTYESKRNAEDTEPFARGINSFQLMNDGSRWWVVSIFWQSESEQNRIPSRYDQ